MSETQTQQPIPKPIAIVLQRHGALQTAYAQKRALHGKRDAFVAAAGEVLSADDAFDLSQLIAGLYDPTYDFHRGPEFGRLLLDDLEQRYQDVGRVEAQTDRWKNMDAVAMAHVLTTDIDVAKVFVRALEERDETTAGALVATVVATIVEKTTNARTPVGRKRTLERTAAILKQRATEGLGTSPELAVLDTSTRTPSDAIALAIWSEAIYLALISAQ